MSDPPEKASPPEKRRWLQYSLKSLLIAMTIAVAVFGAIRWYTAPYLLQRDAAAAFDEAGGSIETIPGDPQWLRDLWGEETVRHITKADLMDCELTEPMFRHVVGLPRVEYLTLGGLEMTDERMQRLDGLETLRLMVLDSTAVTDAAIESLQESIPDLQVFKSERRAIEFLDGTAAVTHLVDLDAPDWLPAAIDVAHLKSVEFVDTEDVTEPIFEHIARLPRVEVVVLGGVEVTDDHLERLSEMTSLRGLVLDSTTVTDEGIESLREALPELYVHKSERQALRDLPARSWQRESRGDPDWLVTIVGPEHFQFPESVTLTNLTDETLAKIRFEAISHLRQLKLSGRIVTDATAARLRDLTHLESLSLVKTSITDGGLAHLDGLSNLTELVISHAEVTDGGIVYLRGLTNLQTLRLDWTRVTEAGLSHFRHLEELTTLNLSWTCIGDLSFVQAFPNLENLSVRDCFLYDESIRHLGRLTKLKQLDLNGNPLSDSALLHLSGLTSLEHLRIRANITDTGIRHLHSLHRLQSLVVDSAVSDEAVSELRSAIPSLVSVLSGVSRPAGAPYNRMSLEKEIEKVRQEKLDTITIGGSATLHLRLIEDLYQLKSMYIHRSIQDDDMLHLRKLTNLTKLKLKSTAVTDDGLVHLSKLGNLEHLDLTESPVSGTGLRHLRNPSRLKHLNLLSFGYGRVERCGCLWFSRESAVVACNEIARFKNLERLCLIYRAITIDGLKDLSQLSQLTVLQLGCTNVTDEGLQYIAKLPKVEVLGLRQTQISDEGLKHFARHPSLKALGLGNTSITDAGVGHLTQLAELEDLRLSGTQITAATLDILPRIPRLRRVWMKNTQISRAAIDQFRKNHPEIQLFDDRSKATTWLGQDIRRISWNF
jgi:Leucine-rich repeat (LRR) protein